MNKADEALRLLGGIGMKIKAFSGDSNTCQAEIDRFFITKKNYEIHSVTSTSCSGDTSYGRFLVIITYSETSDE